MIKFHVGRTFPGGPVRSVRTGAGGSLRPAGPGADLHVLGRHHDLLHTACAGKALEDMVIRREMAMTEFKIMVK